MSVKVSQILKKNGKTDPTTVNQEAKMMADVKTKINKLAVKQAVKTAVKIAVEVAVKPVKTIKLADRIAIQNQAVLVIILEVQQQQIQTLAHTQLQAVVMTAALTRVLNKEKAMSEITMYLVHLQFKN